MRLWPYRVPSEGHYLALVLRGDREITLSERTRPARAPHSTAEVLADFCGQYLTMSIQGRLMTMGARVYRPPLDLPDPNGLRMVRPGGWLGEIRAGRPKPSHALAMALRWGETRLTLDL